jgi:hypothetical protein
MTRLLIDCYFDSEIAKLIRREVLLEVSEHTGLIHRLYDTDDVGQQPVIDLRGLTVLPGFVDTHVHCQRFEYLWCSSDDRQSSCIRTPKHLGKISLPKRAWSSVPSGRRTTPVTLCWQASLLSGKNILFYSILLSRLNHRLKRSRN